MSAPRISLRRPAAGRPAGNLYRVTAAVTFVTVLLFWLLDELLATTAPDPCANVPRGTVCAPPPALDRSDGSPTGLQLLLWTIAVEVLVIACYLALAIVRRTIDVRAALRWSPAAVMLVVLAVGGFGWLFGNTWTLSGTVGVGYLILFACWLLTPLVLYDVYRGDRAAVVPAAIGLAPTVVLNAAFQEWTTSLPAVMLVIALATVAFLHLRRQRS
ncbi:hypothetical protein ACFV9C_29285 [Kribbella sp. NPDC059898]|uniref:hypothetical protein n=1 Tax=Kribbella sp. NPDC059898 TaxID=3346995 RepID=UPI00366A01D1